MDTRRQILQVLAAALALPAGARVAAANRLGAEDAELVARASAYLNGITTLRGRFQQISEAGFFHGSYYIARPGRLRFEYDPPVPLLFVVDGTFVAIDDKELRTVNRYPLSATPLRILLAENVDLAAEARIALIERLPGQSRLTLIEDEGLAQGELTLVFEEPSFALSQWIILDAQGTRTTVRLESQEAGMSLDPNLFRLRDYGYE